jgi:hypothetical protein
MKQITTETLFDLDKNNYPYKTRICRSVAKRLCLDGILPRMGYERRVTDIPASYMMHGVTYQSTNSLWIENLSGYFYAKVYYNV